MCVLCAFCLFFCFSPLEFEFACTKTMVLSICSSYRQPIGKEERWEELWWNDCDELNMKKGLGMSKVNMKHYLIMRTVGILFYIMTAWRLPQWLEKTNHINFNFSIPIVISLQWQQQQHICPFLMPLFPKRWHACRMERNYEEKVSSIIHDSMLSMCGSSEKKSWFIIHEIVFHLPYSKKKTKTDWMFYVGFKSGIKQ